MSSASQRLTPDQAAAFRQQVAVELIHERHRAAVEAFECHPDIDKYLKNDALQACKDGLSMPWLFVHDGAIAGYVTLSANSIQLQPAEREAAHVVSDRATWPALLIGNLGVDKRYRGGGRRLGDFLLQFAVGQAELVAELAAVKFVYAEVYQDPFAIAMYERNGFVRGTHKMSGGTHPKFWRAINSNPRVQELAD
jgi:GNAT superfamily N-acetyltransferase